MKPVLTEAGFEAAAQALNCEVAAIKAVCQVEAPKGGFLADDRVRILFERHKFYKYTGGKTSPFLAHSDICNSHAGGYAKTGAAEYERFSRAFALDAKAAMKSCSWGKFQIMGFNFASAGFETLDAFVNAMKESEDAQLAAFVKIVKSFALADELRRHDWAGFARGYNGENYKINNYDVKLAAAYRRHRNDAPAAAAPTVDDDSTVGHSIVDDLVPVETPAPAERTVGETTDDAVEDAGAVKTNEAPPKEVRAATPSMTTKTIAFGTVGTAVLAAIQQFYATSRETAISAAQVLVKHLPLVFLIVAFAALGIWLYNKAAERAQQRTEKIADIHADQKKNDVIIT